MLEILIGAWHVDEIPSSVLRSQQLGPFIKSQNPRKTRNLNADVQACPSLSSITTFRFIDKSDVQPGRKMDRNGQRRGNA
jgi:hypothetical protein